MDIKEELEQLDKRITLEKDLYTKYITVVLSLRKFPRYNNTNSLTRIVCNAYLDKANS